MIGTLGITIEWPSKHHPIALSLSLKPDPTGPAVVLDESNDADGSSAEACDTLCQLLLYASSVSPNTVSEETVQSLRETLIDLVVALNQNPRVLAMTGGGISTIGIMFPSHIHSRTIENFQEIWGNIDFPTVVLSEDAARIHSFMMKDELRSIILLCHWDQKLTITMARLMKNGRLLARIDEPLRAAHGVQRWTSIAQGRTAEPESVAGQVTSSIRAYSDNRAEQLGGDAVTKIVHTGLRSGLAIIHNEFQRVCEQAFPRQTAQSHQLSVWTSGECFAGRGVLEALRASTEQSGGRVVEYQKPDIFETLPGLIDVPPMLAYDVGVLISYAESNAAVGRLLLVRPSLIGTESRREKFKIPVPNEERLQIAVYLRRLDYETGRLSNEMMHRHLFAPENPISGMAMLNVSAMVTENKENDIRIKVRIEQGQGRQPIVFENLIPEGVATKIRPLRDSRSLVCVRIADHLRELVNQLGDKAPSISIPIWREALSPTRERMITRATYLSLIAEWVGDELSGSLHTPGIVSHASPEAVQRVVRQTAVAQMEKIATAMTASANAPRTRQWLSDTRQSNPDLSFAAAGLNALSQDHAASGEGERLVKSFELALTAFKHGSADPRSINIDWEQH